MEQLPMPGLNKRSVRVKMLAAPVNPADINMIQGTYPILCPLPAVGGNEGLGEVLEVGDEVNTLRPGDWVVPVDAGFGTWRTEAVCGEDDLITVPKDITVMGAATIAVNPCTAYRMLHDFHTLTPGSTVIQNGANSAVGQAVIQIAAAMQIRTINIIRDRPNCAELVKELHALGADYVLTEEEVMSSGLHLYSLSHFQKSLIFKNISLRGFWMTQWKRNHRQDKALLRSMLDSLCELVRSGYLRPPNCIQTPFPQYTKALHATVQPRQRKHVLIM
uniref:Enoyl-[acyl-carrier-protein] reductase, mitochondrial n=1 Tax=Astyanax mexicanus TaxID=7994 RepID=A0A8B9LNT2_ASTMX